MISGFFLTLIKQVLTSGSSQPEGTLQGRHRPLKANKNRQLGGFYFLCRSVLQSLSSVLK